MMKLNKKNFPVLLFAGSLAFAGCTRNTDNNGGVGMNPQGTTSESGQLGGGDLGHAGANNAAGGQSGTTEPMPGGTGGNAGAGSTGTNSGTGNTGGETTAATTTGSGTAPGATSGATAGSTADSHCQPGANAKDCPKPSGPQSGTHSTNGSTTGGKVQ